MNGQAEVLRMTRLHLDASRSAALFADRPLLVEGVTDAALVREFGWVWAGDDADRQGIGVGSGVVQCEQVFVPVSHKHDDCRRENTGQCGWQNDAQKGPEARQAIDNCSFFEFNGDILEDGNQYENCERQLDVVEFLLVWGGR